MKWALALLIPFLLIPSSSLAITNIIGTAVNVAVCTLNITQADTLAARPNTAGIVAFTIDTAAGLWFEGVTNTAPVQTSRIEKGPLSPLGFTSSSANLTTPINDLAVISNNASARLLTFNTNAGSTNTINEFDYTFTNIGSAISPTAGAFNSITIDGSSGVFRTRTNGLGNPVVLERYTQTSPYTRTTANGPNLGAAAAINGATKADSAGVNVYQPNNTSPNSGQFSGTPVSFLNSFNTQTTSAASSSAIDSTNGFAYFSSNGDLQKVRLSDFSPQGTLTCLGPCVLTECCNLVALDLTKGKLYWATRTSTPSNDIYRVDLATFTIEQRFIAVGLSASGLILNALQIDTTQQKLYLAQIGGAITAFNICL